MTEEFEKKLEQCVHEHLERAREGERKRIAHNLADLRCSEKFIARAVQYPER